MNPAIRTSIRTAILAVSIAIHPSFVHADPPSLSELLEKGIYAEETKGDVDGAITIYQQLVAEAIANQSVGAQAEYRLALCLLKKNRLPEANAAFEKLIHDFPDEKELVVKAREHLPSKITLGPIPWADGERMQLGLRLPGGLNIGTVEYRAYLAESDGKKVWRMGGRLNAGAQSFSRVDADLETLKPLNSRWKHALLGDVSAIYEPAQVKLQRVGVAEPTVIKLDRPVFDNEEAVELMRMLPLKTGYKTTLPLVASLGASTIIPVGLEVTGEEPVEVPVGKFNCWRVKLNIGQVFWYSTGPKHELVKFEAGGAIAELTSIAQRRPDEVVPFHDDELGFSLVAPPNWVVFLRKIPQRKSVSVLLLDPEADCGSSELSLLPTEERSEEERKSSRAWAEAALKDTISKELEGVKLQEDSWKEQKIGGLSGVSFVVDFTENDKPQKGFFIYALGPKTSLRFQMSCAPDKFDALQSAFLSVAVSYKSTK